MAEVWESMDTTLDREVAVKLLHSHLADDPGFVSRFRREARAVARLSHPNIVAVYDTGIDVIPDGRPGAGLPRAYLVMELLRGVSVRVLSQQGITVTRAVSIVANAAKGLGYAHRQGLVHRDVKPANILVTEGGLVKVVDFGIAKVTEGTDRGGEDLTQAGAILGTAKYLSPEQVEGTDVDARADVYALGVVLFELCCGRPPFVGRNDMATAMCHVKDTPPSPRSIRPAIPQNLEAVILAALSKDPGQRPANGDAFAAQLDNLNIQADDAIPAIRRTEADRTPAAGTPRQATQSGRATAGRGDETRLDPSSGQTTHITTSTRGNAPQPDATSVQQRPGKNLGRRKRTVIRTLVTLITVAAGLAGGVVLAQQTRTTDTSIRIVGIRSFDPLGNGEENDENLPRAIDNKADTAWLSQGYSNRQLDGKDGVGVIVDLGDQAGTTVRRVITTSTDDGWSAEIYVAPRRFDNIEEWSAFRAGDARNVRRGTTTIEVTATTGRYVLIWITDLGPKIGSTFRAAFSEIRVEG
jgi:serine/threonine protein kinase